MGRLTERPTSDPRPKPPGFARSIRPRADSASSRSWSEVEPTRLDQQARLAYARAQTQRYQDTAQLFVAMGGRWWQAPALAASAGCEPNPAAGGCETR